MMPDVCSNWGRLVEVGNAIQLEASPEVVFWRQLVISGSVEVGNWATQEWKKFKLVGLSDLHS